MSDDDVSDLSSLSSLSSLSPVPSSDESDIQLRPEKGILKFFHKVPKPKTTIKLTNKSKASAATAAEIATSKKKKKTGGKGGAAVDDSDDSDAAAAKREREPSPPHEYVLADNQDIAFIVMFRNRFADAFPKNLANFGPQELERDIVDTVPSERVEHFLCTLLKLLLNRQQDVKPGHYHRALEEAVQSHKAQWPTSWTDSPLADGKTFASMTPSERLALLRALVLWAMSSSKAVRDVIELAYKSKRKDEDANIPIAVQSWGSDSDKRRYYLIEGRDDTSFRIYRESNPAAFIHRTWWSVAGSIDEIKLLIERLETKDGGPKARKLAKRLNDEIPRFEATEEKRRRREYRQQQRDRFKRPEPGFSLYEGRTRGKRIKYTYSDDEDLWSDSTGPRRSARHTGTHTPAEPVTTASGRQIRAPHRLNGSLSAAASTQGDSAMEGEAAAENDDEHPEREPSVGPTGRPRRSAAINHGMNGWARPTRRSDGYDEYDSQAEDEESEPELGDDEDEDDEDEDDGDEHIPDGENDEDEDEEAFDEKKDAMLLDKDEAAELVAGSSVVVKMPVKAVLDAATGKWGKETKEAKEETGDTVVNAVDASDAADGVSAQQRPGTLTPVNSHNNSKNQDDGDITMTGWTTQGSEETATMSPAQQAQAQAQTATKLDNGGVPDVADKQARAGTPEKENGVAGVGASLAYRSSPEKTHQAARSVDAVGN